MAMVRFSEHAEHAYVSFGVQGQIWSICLGNGHFINASQKTRP